MNISKLEIFGFKSFAKKETVLFNSGITGIVGPNGCGKTNIVDAIRWVLGEQKTKRLRSSKMEEVIFNGASNVKPLGLCEVFLTIENNKGLLPVEYSEVEIGRRLYRSGESEYFINRNNCRLKDISNLFVDTGLTSDAYSVIELNMIEQILSDKDDSRRNMFEEAAGVNKYKAKRRSTLKKFDLNSRDLERIDDIIVEIQIQVKALDLQLKRFKRHEKLTNELQALEIDLASARTNDLANIIAPLEEMLKKNILPRHVIITGKKKMKMKIDVYQNDGFWFATPRDEGEIRWRLWVEAGLLLNPPTKSKLLKVAKKVKK